MSGLGEEIISTKPNTVRIYLEQSDLEKTKRENYVQMISNYDKSTDLKIGTPMLTCWGSHIKTFNTRFGKYSVVPQKPFITVNQARHLELDLLVCTWLRPSLTQPAAHPFKTRHGEWIKTYQIVFQHVWFGRLHGQIFYHLLTKQLYYLCM